MKCCRFGIWGSILDVYAGRDNFGLFILLGPEKDKRVEIRGGKRVVVREGKRVKIRFSKDNPAEVKEEYFGGLEEPFLVLREASPFTPSREKGYFLAKPVNESRGVIMLLEAFCYPKSKDEDKKRGWKVVSGTPQRIKEGHHKSRFDGWKEYRQNDYLIIMRPGDAIQTAVWLEPDSSSKSEQTVVLFVDNNGFLQQTEPDLYKEAAAS